MAQSTVGTLNIDQLATDSILASTTDTDFLTRWVGVLPNHPTVPSPREVLGYTIGAEGELSSVDDIYRYFEAIVNPLVDVGTHFERSGYGISRQSSLSGFFAALYLTPLDRHFENKTGLFYLRYNDDGVPRTLQKLTAVMLHWR